MDPEFREIYGDQAPPKRTEEDRRARLIKGLVGSNQKSKAKAAEARKARDPSDEESDDDRTSDTDHEPSTDLTIATTKPRREGLKRKTYHDEDADYDLASNSQSEQDTPTKRPRFTHEAPPKESNPNSAGRLPVLLDGEATVIIGAGTVGLFIARELAIAAKQSGIEHHVVVIEFRNSYCELASGHCAGFLSTKGMPEDWDTIAMDAKEWWFEQFASADIRARLEFDANTRYQVVEGGTKDGDAVPRWLREKVSWSLMEDEHSIGRMWVSHHYIGGHLTNPDYRNPKYLASWVYEQCTTLGVDFYLEHKVVNVNYSAATGVAGVQICDVSTEESIIGVPCSNLVLAAGAFTTGIFETLFPKAPLKLENHLQSSDWFLVGSVQTEIDDNAAFRFPSAAESEERLNGEICMVIDAENDTIAISGMATHIRDKSLNTSLVKDPSHGKVSELRRVAADCVNTTLVNVQEKINTGHRRRWELSVANGMRPIIDGVPRSSLRPFNSDAVETQMPCGIWLCYGFGNYGTVLAPGVAKILLTRIGSNNEDVSANVDAFRLPYQLPSQDLGMVEFKGKGQGKARVI